MLEIEVNPNSLPKIQDALRDALVEFTNLLDNAEIEYWLDFGTLLGAVRHGDFIPWDDDIDITIKYSDRKKLFSLFKDNALSKLVCIQQSRKNPLNAPVKIVLKGTLVEEYELSKRGIDSSNYFGLAIDVFFVNRTSKLGTSGKWVGTIFSQMWQVKQLVGHQTADKTSKENVIKILNKKIISLIPYFLLEKAIFSLNHLIQNRRGQYLRYSIGSNYSHYSFNVNDLFPLRRYETFGNVYNVPKLCDVWLNRLYGDQYMKMPLLENRRTHSTRLWVSHDSYFIRYFQETE